jgi:hypothetical protein
MERVREFFGRLTEVYKEGDGDLADTAARLMGQHIAFISQTDALLAQFPVAERDTPNDDPLACQAGAIVASMPPQLLAIATSDSSINVARVWTTLCCVCMLQELPFSWIWGDGDLYSAQERTIVDAACEWIEEYADQHPSLKEVLADDMMRKRAMVLTRLWVRTFEQRICDLRSSPAIVAQRNLSQVHRTATEVLRALVMRHDTFSVFLSEPMDGMQRWQLAMVLVSVVCSHLLVNIWMFYAKSVECCAGLRLILNSGPDGGNCPPAPGACRGFEGTCGDITAQFAELPVLPDYPNGMQDWVCTVFPDDANEADAFLIGLIAIVVALPVTLFISTCFEIANDSEAPESWLEWTGWRKLVFGRRAHRRWRYTGPDGQPVRYVRWFVRSASAPVSETFANLCRSLYAWVTRTEVPWLVEAREAALEEADAASTGDADEASCRKCADGASESGSTSSSVRSARALMHWKRFVVSTGLVGVYVTWAVFAWCASASAAFLLAHSTLTPRAARSPGTSSPTVRVLSAHAVRARLTAAPAVSLVGLLVYNLMGKSGENSFIRSWGVSYGLNAATQWRDIVVEALKGLVVLAVLERMLLTSNIGWMEDHLDYLCLQSLLLQHTDLSMAQQVRFMFARSKRLQD